ncbi:unnamed protein product [Zymoseptoria tritici ST99CH_3D7]|uniref:Uncharacterized protein n=1 Tax=Zymoseptoria tritici (strain ST99CH_3D7) TaxID=1276538 RepID=A0A1X7RDI0_ZYMT9|nr:unnamed protein product [Zymoseptoria tritici ST99CH_3D7]
MPNQILPSHPEVPGHRALYKYNGIRDGFDGPCMQSRLNPYREERSSLINGNNCEWNGNLDNGEYTPVHRLDQAVYTNEALVRSETEFAESIIEIHETHDDSGMPTGSIIYQVTLNTVDGRPFDTLNAHQIPATSVWKNDSYRSHPSFTHKRFEYYASTQADFQTQMPRVYKNDRWDFTLQLHRLSVTKRQRQKTHIIKFTPVPELCGRSALDEVNEADLRDAAEPLLFHADRPTATIQDLREAFIASLPKDFVDPISGTLLDDAVYIVGTNAADTLVSRQPFYEYQQTAKCACRKDFSSPMTGDEYDAENWDFTEYTPIAIPNAANVQPNVFVPYTEASHADRMTYEYVKLRLRRDKLITQMIRMEKEARENHGKEVQDFQQQVKRLQQQVEEGRERERGYQDQVHDLQKQLSEL